MKLQRLNTVEEYVTHYLEISAGKQPPRTTTGRLTPTRLRMGLARMEAFLPAGSEMEIEVQRKPSRLWHNGLIRVGTDEYDQKRDRIFQELARRKVYCDGHLVVLPSWSIQMLHDIRMELLARAKRRSDKTDNVARYDEMKRWREVASDGYIEVLESRLSGATREDNPTGTQLEYLGVMSTASADTLYAVFGERYTANGTVYYSEIRQGIFDHWCLARLYLPDPVTVYHVSGWTGCPIWTDHESGPVLAGAYGTVDSHYTYMQAPEDANTVELR